MTKADTNDFDALVAKAWKKGMKSGDLKFKTFKSDIGTDNGIPYEARYLPTLEEKAEEAEDDDDDEEDEDDEEGDADKQQQKKSDDPEEEDPKSKPLRRATTDAEEEKGVQERDDTHDDVEEGHGDEKMEMDPSEDPFLPPRKFVSQIIPQVCCILITIV